MIHINSKKGKKNVLNCEQYRSCMMQIQFFLSPLQQENISKKHKTLVVAGPDPLHQCESWRKHSCKTQLQAFLSLSEGRTNKRDFAVNGAVSKTLCSPPPPPIPHLFSTQTRRALWTGYFQWQHNLASKSPSTQQSFNEDCWRDFFCDYHFKL